MLMRRSLNMKTLIHATLVAGVLVLPALSFAQETNAPLTRAQVRQELIRVEQAGYQPGVNDVYYPSDIQAAEARIQARDSGAPANTSAGGVPMSGSSQSASPVPVLRPASPQSTYFGGS
jgi:Domain of unknown function (DUF4148)